jgi:hypothetical protein
VRAAALEKDVLAGAERHEELLDAAPPFLGLADGAQGVAEEPAAIGLPGFFERLSDVGERGCRSALEVVIQRGLPASQAPFDASTELDEIRCQPSDPWIAAYRPHAPIPMSNRGRSMAGSAIRSSAKRTTDSAAPSDSTKPYLYGATSRNGFDRSGPTGRPLTASWS